MGNTSHGGRIRSRALATMLRISIVALAPVRCFAAMEPLRGLPITRSYSFGEIGDVSRGCHLAFDNHGRLLVVQDGVIVALNDREWLNLTPKVPTGVNVQAVKRDADGTLYFGAQGTCGILRPGNQGRLIADPLVAQPLPAWVLEGTFDSILCRPEGIYFSSFSGVMFWDKQRLTMRVLEAGGLAALFVLDDRVYVSMHDYGVRPLDVATMTLGPTDTARFGKSVISHVAARSDGTAIVSTTGRRLWLYSRNQLLALPPPLDRILDGQVEALATLSNDEVCAAINGKGLCFIGADDRIARAWTGPGYERISTLATDEPGVIWYVSESGVTKVLSGTPLEWFGQSAGLNVNWPEVARWQDRIIIDSNGRPYEAAPTEAGEPTRFQLMEGQPQLGSWAIGTFEDFLLLANGDGVFARRPGQPFARISTVPAARLIVLPSGLCFAVGTTSIAALQYRDGTWKECAPRVAGFGYPSVVHAGLDSGWIEIGANRAVRLAVHNGRIEPHLFDLPALNATPWLCVSIVDNVAVLSGPESGRMFFDEKTEQLVPHAPIEALLNAAPCWVARVARDEEGTYWLSHFHGVIAATRRGAGFDFDVSTYRSFTDHTPLVRAIPGAGVWLSRGNSLYRATRPTVALAGKPIRPIVISVTDTRTKAELLERVDARELPHSLSFRQNSLAIRFFAGSYALKQAPWYEYRINENPWNELGANSVLPLSDLQAGAYDLAVRLADDMGPFPATTRFHLVIQPPWYRTWWAEASYAALLAALVAGAVGLFLRRARARNTELTTLVAERTAELEATMQKLEQETRTAATLAERNRLAGEIHDSLEQGFSALSLHLETIADIGDHPPAVTQALATARNMITFSRSEVRHAIWDLHSPLLDQGGLESALRNLVYQLTSDPVRASVTVEGQPQRLNPTVEHHLLRIAQEAIANAIKHAGASHLEVKLHYRTAELELAVCDDGRGFDAESVLAGPAKQDHFGLRNLRSRARRIGAAIAIDSECGRGTRITVRLPYPTQS